jgi:prepilin-type N-terminal cleavage/methylation domain-containing protein
MEVMTARRGARRGFTLLEILLALAVLLVGLVGILTLFPVGIRSVGESTMDTMAAIVAESVQQALMKAMRMPGTPGATRRITVYHDGFPPTGLTFDLPPATQAGTTFYVAPGTPQTTPFGANTIFTLGTDPTILATYDQIVSGSSGGARLDPSEGYRQYQFSIDVRRVPNEALFEFTIHVYRNFFAYTGTIAANQVHPKQIKQFRVQIGRVTED